MPFGGQTLKERKYSHTDYYARGAKGPGRGGRFWEHHEIDAILAADKPTDKELSLALDRSILAIQIKRCRIIANKSKT